jgi:hypothetical protein
MGHTESVPALRNRRTQTSRSSKRRVVAVLQSAAIFYANLENRNFRNTLKKYHFMHKM